MSKKNSNFLGFRYQSKTTRITHPYAPNKNREISTYRPLAASMIMTEDLSPYYLYNYIFQDNPDDSNTNFFDSNLRKFRTRSTLRNKTTSALSKSYNLKPFKKSSNYSVQNNINSLKQPKTTLRQNKNISINTFNGRRKENGKTKNLSSSITTNYNMDRKNSEERDEIIRQLKKEKDELLGIGSSNNSTAKKEYKNSNEEKSINSQNKRGNYNINSMKNSRDLQNDNLNKKNLKGSNIIKNQLDKNNIQKNQIKVNTQQLEGSKLNKNTQSQGNQNINLNYQTKKNTEPLGTSSLKGSYQQQDKENTIQKSQNQKNSQSILSSKTGQASQQKELGNINQKYQNKQNSQTSEASKTNQFSYQHKKEDINQKNPSQQNSKRIETFKINPQQKEKENINNKDKDIKNSQNSVDSKANQFSQQKKENINQKSQNITNVQQLESSKQDKDKYSQKNTKQNTSQKSPSKKQNKELENKNINQFSQSTNKEIEGKKSPLENSQNKEDSKNNNITNSKIIENENNKNILSSSNQNLENSSELNKNSKFVKQDMPNSLKNNQVQKENDSSQNINTNKNDNEELRDSNISIVKKLKEKTIFLVPGQTIEPKSIAETFENPVEEVIKNPDGTTTSLIKQTKVIETKQNFPIKDNKKKSIEEGKQLPMIKQYITYEYQTVTTIKDNEDKSGEGLDGQAQFKNSDIMNKNASLKQGQQVLNQNGIKGLEQQGLNQYGNKGQKGIEQKGLNQYENKGQKEVGQQGNKGQKEVGQQGNKGQKGLSQEGLNQNRNKGQKELNQYDENHENINNKNNQNDGMLGINEENFKNNKNINKGINENTQNETQQDDYLKNKQLKGNDNSYGNQFEDKQNNEKNKNYMNGDKHDIILNENKQYNFSPDVLPEGFKNEEELENFLDGVNEKGGNATPEEKQKRLKCFEDIINNISKEGENTEENLQKLAKLLSNINEKDRQKILDILSKNFPENGELFKKLTNLVQNSVKKGILKGKGKLRESKFSQNGKIGNLDIENVPLYKSVKYRQSGNSRGFSSPKRRIGSSIRGNTSEFIEVEKVNPLKFDGLFLDISKYNNEHKNSNPFEGPSPYCKYYKDRKRKIKKKIDNMPPEETEDLEEEIFLSERNDN